MKLLVVGSGGREHALVWKLRKSPLCSEIYCAPGNVGMKNLANLVPIQAGEIPRLAAWSKQERIDLVIVGPEAPLAQGLSDALRAERIPVFGPSQAAAQIESSKIFARRLMQKYGIPSPEFETFDSPGPAKEFANRLYAKGKKAVVKADGLAAGKGAIVTSTPAEAVHAIELCMEKRAFGDAGNNVVIEERLSGPELSILAVTDGNRLVILPPAQDHKAIGERDTGPNTGGMGAYSPVPIVDEALMNAIRKTILEPTIRGMNAEGVPYSGVLYAGLMLCDGNPYVIEFNCRFGDPETQAVLPVIEEDVLPILIDAANGYMRESRVISAFRNALCVVMASKGYPDVYEKGKVILGLDTVEEQFSDQAIVFHAGTAEKDGKIVTSGGRVLGVTGWGTDFHEAYANACRAVHSIYFDGVYYRRDIGYRVR